MKRILMVAYHFPPLAGSSGIQRTLRFVQHLPKFGWEPIVLTASPIAYERTSEDLIKEIPAGVLVRRAFALDTARHLAINGRYIAAMARPDRWISWKFDGIRQGMELIREFKPRIIWSTYPIATAHIIGAELSARTGIPWVADFRDPMAQDDYPSDLLTRQQFLEIEAQAVRRAALSLFTTPGAARVYRQRYPEAAQRIRLLENGYDEENFFDVEKTVACEPLNPGALTVLHSGIVYPSERDPTQLFVALARLKEALPETARILKIRFRAAVHDDLLAKLTKSYGVETFIEVLPPIPYKQALGEMLQSDGLLVMQASNCNQQVPAKVYEYMRAGRPILALTDSQGDTARVLEQAGCVAFADLGSVTEIYDLLVGFINGKQTNAEFRQEIVEGASRQARTKSLASMMDALPELGLQ